MTTKQFTEIIISLPTANGGEGTQPEGEEQVLRNQFYNMSSRVIGRARTFCIHKLGERSGRLQKLQSCHADRVRGC